MNAYQNAFDQEVLCAEPMELVVILYSALRDSIKDARLSLAKNDIEGRARSVSRAVEIIGELASSLDHERGGEVASGLRRLYAFMAESLLDGSFRQVDEPLAAAERVTITLLEAWQELRPRPAAAVDLPAYAFDASGFGAASSLSISG